MTKGKMISLAIFVLISILTWLSTRSIAQGTQIALNVNNHTHIMASLETIITSIADLKEDNKKNRSNR